MDPPKPFLPGGGHRKTLLACLLKILAREAVSHA